jgi:hypothetical protein
MDNMHQEQFNSTVLSKLDLLLTKLTNVQSTEREIMADLTSLTAQVTANMNAESSAIQLITNIAAALKAAGTDPVAIAALQTQLETSRSALAAAVVANTPAA